MRCEVRLISNGMIFTGIRTWDMAWRETRGFHHFKVTHFIERPEIVGKTIAVPLTNIEYLIILSEKD